MPCWRKPDLLFAGSGCASSNDQTFTHSDMRRTARLLMQFLPGTDFISSGYSAVPNYDNMFAGSNEDAEDLTTTTLSSVT